MPSPGRLAGLCAVALALAGLPAPAGARLASPPFELALDSTAPTEGGSLTIAVERAGPAPPSAPERLDVYISVLRDGSPGWIYMTPSGAFVGKPAVFQSGVRGPTIPGLPVTLRGVGPPGWYLVRVQFIRAAAALPARRDYVYRPLLATVRVAPRADGGGTPLAVGGLGLLTLGVLAVIFLGAPREPRSLPPTSTQGAAQ